MIPVPHRPRSLEPYRQLLGEGVISDIRETAEDLRGLRIAHVNATPLGGGVAEILSSLVPLMADVGLTAQWWALDPHPEFFAVTKKIHNSLQGMEEASLSRQEIDLYMDYNRRLAEQIEEQSGDADVLILHDPQVLPSVSFMNNGRRVIWHCHLDTSTPSRTGLELIAPLTHLVTHSIVSMPTYSVDGMSRNRLSVLPPAIDPFSPKNSPLPRPQGIEILSRMGLDPSRPLVTQVSRFDPWKDPLGVIDAYRLVKREVPALQLALLGAMTAQDDPESVSILETVRAHADGDPDIHIFFEPEDGEAEPVNAFQSLSTVVVQKSIREGFGLTVTEAMWKGAAIVGGDCGGIAFQIQDGVSGYLASSPEECASHLLRLINDPEERARIGAHARERVLTDFLMPRLLLDYLRLLTAATGPGSSSSS